MSTKPLTILMSIANLDDPDSTDSYSMSKIKPSDITRMAFEDDQVEISNQDGPQKDGRTEIVDVIGGFTVKEIGKPEYDRAFIVRLGTDRGLDTFEVQQIGTVIENYMDRHGTVEFATAAIGDMDTGKDLHGRWNTILFLRNAQDGTWTVRNLRFTSVQKSVSNGFAILKAQKMVWIRGEDLFSILLDNGRLGAFLQNGHQIEGEKAAAHLVRAPINKGGAYAVVSGGLQTVYNAKFKVIASGKTGFTVMPAIDVDGTYQDGKVTTVSGQGNQWDVRKAIPAKQADALAQAFGATA